MIQYLRIPKHKFWGWVFASMAVGLLLGAVGAYAVSRASTTQQIAELKQQLQTAMSESASSTASLQAQLDSRDASLTALSEKYATLEEQAAAAKTAAAKKTSSSTTTATLEVQVRTVRPSTVATGDDITLTARVQGKPDKVTMRIYNKTTGYDETYKLKRSSHSDTTETWRLVIAAPKKKGTYSYYATAYQGDKSATQPGASPASFKVE
jgi:hypothetical protein